MERHAISVMDRYSVVKSILSNERFIVWRTDYKRNAAHVIPMDPDSEFADMKISLKRWTNCQAEYVRDLDIQESLMLACNMLNVAEIWGDHILARRDCFRLSMEMRNKDIHFDEMFFRKGYVVGDMISVNVQPFFEKISYLSKDEAEIFHFTNEELIYCINGMISARDYYKDKCKKLERI